MERTLPNNWNKRVIKFIYSGLKLRIEMLDEVWMNYRNTGSGYDRVIGTKFRCVY